MKDCLFTLSLFLHSLLILHKHTNFTYLYSFMLLFGFVAELLAATVSLGNMLNPKLLSDPFIGISALRS